MSQLNNTQMPLSVWGPLFWDWFHNLSICYPNTPTYNEAYETYKKIENFILSLPCPTCKTHAINYIQQNSINLVNDHGFQLWVWKFHNSVNQRTGKPIFTKQDFFNKYHRYI